MKKTDDLKDVFRLSGVFIGGVIGAGFASGKELYEFFIVYGSKWVLGLFIGGIIFSLCLYGIIKISNENKNISDYGSFMSHIMGKIPGKIMEIISGVFLFVLFFAMISASGVLGREAFGLNYGIGVGAILLFSLIIFIKGESGIVILNSLLAPVLVSGCIFLGIYTLLSREVPVFGSMGQSWFFSAILYSSYNIITVIPVIVPLRGLAKTGRKAFLSGIIGGMGIFAVGLSVGTVLWLSEKGIEGSIPMLSALTDFGEYILLIYKIVLISAIFTTAAANGYAALNWVGSKVKLKGIKLYIIILGAGAAASRIGFSGFVEVFYPFFGYLGIAEIIVIIFFTFLKVNINCK